MKIYIGKPRDHWISPFTIMDYVFWWTDWSKCSRDRRIRSLEEESTYVEHPAWVERWSDRLTPVSQAIQWVLDRVHPAINIVKIDYWDTWSMDHTLSPIILPMLRQLKEAKHGAPFVDDEDVPDHLKSTAAPAKENEWDTDANHFDRWDWVMGEMIFAFTCKVDDSWEEEFRSGEHDLIHVPCEWDANGRPTMYQMKDGPNNTYKCDYEGMRVVEARIQNGFRLFGKYYQNLWD
jgi:hypothetical protein